MVLILTKGNSELNVLLGSTTDTVILTSNRRLYSSDCLFVFD